MEKAFDVYKNDLDGSRSRTGNPDRARGRLFIKFVALILRIHSRTRYATTNRRSCRPRGRRTTSAA